MSVFIDPDMIDYVNEVRPYSVALESTQKCPGSCAYCYAGSTIYTETSIPTKKVKELVDDCADLGMKAITWGGGDPLYHPDWEEHIKYAADKGLRNWVACSSLISKDMAKKIYQLGSAIEQMILDISTINPEAYEKLHTDPSTLEKKMQGYRNLLEAGYPAQQIMPILALTKPAIETLEETLDWFIDEMGANCACLVVFKPDMFGDNYRFLEPTVDEIRGAMEYRAKKLGSEWLQLGTMDTYFFFCRTSFGVKYDGRVVPCVNVPVAVGNIYQESLKDIFERERDILLFNHAIEGFCGSGECQYSSTCFGCRGTAYFCHNAHNMWASDDKCYLNPMAKDKCF